MSLNYGGAQWEALAVRWVTGRIDDEQKEALLAEMSRNERRRFARLLEKAEEKKIHSGESFVTKRELSYYLQSYIESNVAQVGQNVDALEARVTYLELPIWGRWRVRAYMLWIKFNHWLHRHGIRIVRLEAQEGDDAEAAEEGRGVPGAGEDAHVPPGGLAGARRPAERGGAEVHEPAEADGLRGEAGDRARGAEGGDGARDARGDGSRGPEEEGGAQEESGREEEGSSEEGQEEVAYRVSPDRRSVVT